MESNDDLITLAQRYKDRFGDPNNMGHLNFTWNGPCAMLGGYPAAQSMTIQCNAQKATTYGTHRSNTLQQLVNKSQQVAVLISHMQTQMNNWIKAMSQTVHLQTTFLNTLAQALG